MLSLTHMPDDQQDALVASLTSADRADHPALTIREQAMLVYADRLTREPATITTTDIDALRSAGLDDRGIHDLCAIVAYFAFVNRIADGLGVELEPLQAPQKRDQRLKFNR